MSVCDQIIENSSQLDIVYDINTKLHHLHGLITECDALVNKHNTDVTFHIHLYEECKKNLQLMNMLVKTPTIEAQQKFYANERERILNAINDRRSYISHPIETIFNLLYDVQSSIVIHRLNKWRCEQLLVVFGYGSAGTSKVNKFENLKKDLDEIQIQYEALFTHVLNTRKLLNNIYCIQDEITILDNVQSKFIPLINKLLCNLISNSFIVDEQPPQVIKKDTRFEASVRLLLPNFVKDEQEYSVTVSILSETLIEKQQNLNIPLIETSGVIKIPNRKFERCQQYPVRLTCNLKYLRLNKVIRSEKKRVESVTDEKHVLLFQATLHVEDMQQDTIAMSLPVVAIVHGTQESQAWATIAWNNLLVYYARPPVTVSVPWFEISFTLYTIFQYQTDCTLSDPHLKYLEQRAIKSNLKVNNEISYSSFCKTKLGGFTFTLWDWFFAITKLTREHLKKPWKAGFIVGFISRNETEEILINSRPGTFLLRFSNTVLGGLSVAWIENNNGISRIEHLQPFTSKDLGNSHRYIETIGDLIKDIDQCQYLYPDTPKDIAFGEYYTKFVPKTDNGYVIPKRPFIVPSYESEWIELNDAPRNILLRNSTSTTTHDANSVLK